MLLDATGSEITVVYKNQLARKLRSDNLEATFMVSSMINPPQGGEYKPLSGDLFPEEYPFNWNEKFTYSYFWYKYYLTQRNIFSLAKRPIYVNYEVLSNVFATNVIDFSAADIYELNNTEMDRETFESLLESQNEHTFAAFYLRYQQMIAMFKTE